jgi:tRNA(Arg) A34 adenosine deaminase TadA
MTDYLKMAVEQSRKSFEAGEFPAGAVLVSKAGKIYESDPSVPHYHGETMVIDKAIAAEGAPLAGATIYASMEPCLMCAAKMYWSGVYAAKFVIPKAKVNAEYAYEDDVAMQEHIKHFFKKFDMQNEPTLLDEAMRIYNSWVKKIEGRGKG